MSDASIYADIAQRTGGAVMIGVVGPVRTGKSTFIKRFMETMVIPNIDNEYARERAKDELPQSGSGKTIMTSEPKFVPEEAVSMTVDGDVQLSSTASDIWWKARPDSLKTERSGWSRRPGRRTRSACPRPRSSARRR